MLCIHLLNLCFKFMFLVCVLSSCIKFMFWIRFRLMFCVRVPRSCSTFMFCIHVPCSNSYICRQKKLYWISYLSFQIWNLGSQLRNCTQAITWSLPFRLPVHILSLCSDVISPAHGPRSWSEVMVQGHGLRSWSEVMVQDRGLIIVQVLRNFRSWHWH